MIKLHVRHINTTSPARACPKGSPCNLRLDDYYLWCEKMHGADKTKSVAQSLRRAIDQIEHISKQVSSTPGS
jgi:hypothetical protein